MNAVLSLKEELKFLSEQTKYHLVFSTLQSKKKICEFLELQCFQSWAQLCLLKAIEKNITSPQRKAWTPGAKTEILREIRLLILHEETTNFGHKTQSQLEELIDILEDLNGDIRPILQFITQLEMGIAPQIALNKTKLKQTAIDWINFYYYATFLDTHIQLGILYYTKIQPHKESFTQWKSFAIDHPDLTAFIQKNCGLSEMKEELLESFFNTELKNLEALTAAKQALKMQLQLWDHLANQNRKLDRDSEIKAI